MCVCLREREREKRKKEKERKREREREREKRFVSNPLDRNENAVEKDLFHSLQHWEHLHFKNQRR